MQDGRFP